MNEHEHEPIKGLPARPPADEDILWQGTPSWMSLAIHAFHARKAALYCGLIILWHGSSALLAGDSLMIASATALGLLPLACAGVGLLAFLAWVMARSTVFTITTRRVVVRFGVALPMCINLPFKTVKSAALKLHADGTGDIPLELTGDDRIAYLHLWPYVRRWHFENPQPMLRCIPDAAEVAKTLSRALATAAQVPVPQAPALDSAATDGDRGPLAAAHS